MKRVFFFFCLSLVILLPLCAGAADSPARPDINIPASIAVENKNDITLYTLTELLGDPFKEVAGKAASEGPASYSGLLIGILGVLNILSMIYVGASMVYLWAVFAATTAHNGEKLGGGVYDSLWVPLRQAGAFVLTVPVLKGLSVMQMLLIACISISINFANTIWNAASKYMVEHGNVGIIETAVAPMDESVYRALPLMFRDAVIQQIDLSLVENGKDPFPMKGNKEDSVSFWPVDFSGSLNDDVLSRKDDGKLMFFADRQRGEARIQVRTTTNMLPDNIGTVFVNYPPGEKTGKDTYAFDLKRKIAGIKLGYLARIYGDIYAASTVYLQSRASSNGDSGCAFAENGTCKPASAAKEAISNAMNKVVANIDAMTKEVNDAISASVNSQSKKKIEESISKSLDMEDGKSKYGWATAGVFNFSLALLQKEFNESVASSISSTPFSSLTSESDIFMKNMRKVLKDRNKISALERADEYFNSIALKNEKYSESFLQSSYDKNGKTDEGLGLVQSLIIKQFAGDAARNQTTYSGILGVVLSELGAHDPIVVMQNFGSKVFDAMADNWGAITLGSVASGMALGVPFTILSVFLIIMLGAFFCYIVPVIPFIFWLMALVSWLFMVIEAMVAAPFWVCTHVMPEGRGFVGDHARKGYMLLLELISRPPLLVVGAVFAVAMCQVIGWMLNRLLAYWFGNLAANFLSINFFGDIMYTILVLSLVYYVYYMVFTKGVIYMPEAALKWCGAGSGMGLQGNEQTMRHILGAGGALSVGTSAGMLASTGTVVVRGAGKGLSHVPHKLKEKLKGKLNEKITEENGDVGAAPVTKKPVVQISERSVDDGSTAAPIASTRPPTKPVSFAERVRTLLKKKGKGTAAAAAVAAAKASGTVPEQVVKETVNEVATEPETPRTELSERLTAGMTGKSPDILNGKSGQVLDSLTGKIRK